MSEVLVLNASYEPLQRVSVRHAAKMLVRQVAVVETAEAGRSLGPFPFPRVLRLVRYVSQRWRYGSPRWTRSRLLARDGKRCGYCGERAGTVDHVLPQSRGGATSWENTVAACLPCNGRKANRTPEEAGMRLLVVPYVPSAWQLSAGV